MPIGIMVTGPPRSGTSATTRLINLSGAQLCVKSDLVGGGPNNPTGHWESKTVLTINNALHDAAATRWWCPLPPAAVVPTSTEGDAASRFRAVHPGRPWLCKDPRFSFTLPFWRRALGEEIIVVAVVRRPDEVVASLQRTWPMSTEHAAALWARYTHATLAACAAGPSLVVRFPDILAAVEDLTEAIAALGPGLSAADEQVVGDFVHTPRGADAGEPLPPYVWDIWAALATTPAVVSPVPLAAEPPVVEAVLGRLRDELRAGRPLDMRPQFARAEL
jgi:hypothetical protein